MTVSRPPDSVLSGTCKRTSSELRHRHQHRNAVRPHRRRKNGSGSGAKRSAAQVPVPILLLRQRRFDRHRCAGRGNTALSTNTGIRPARTAAARMGTGSGAERSVAQVPVPILLLRSHRIDRGPAAARPSDGIRHHGRGGGLLFRVLIVRQPLRGSSGAATSRVPPARRTQPTGQRRCPWRSRS